MSKECDFDPIEAAKKYGGGLEENEDAKILSSSGQKRQTTTRGGKIVPVEKEIIKFQWASETERKPVKYSWFPYIIDNNVNTFGGEAGTGKTWNLSAIMAAITTDKQPEGMPGRIEKRGNVLYLGGEDGNDEMSRRLETMGANLSKVALVENSLDCMGNGLTGLLDEVDPAMVIFDSLLSYFPEGLNPNAYTDARRVMDYLRDLSRERELSTICVVHPPKKQDNRLIYRFTGSGGFVDAVRSVTYLGYHPTDKSKRVGIQPKNNTIDTVPYVFQLDRDLGLIWCGDDESIKIKDVEKALRVEMGRSGNLQYYIRVIEDVLRINPQGLDMTAADILKEYKKVQEHDIGPQSFGQALNNDAFKNALLRRDIRLLRGANAKNRQKYQIHYKGFEPLTLKKEI